MFPEQIEIYFTPSFHELEDKFKIRIKENAIIALKIIKKTNGVFITSKTRVNLSNMLQKTEGILHRGGSQVLFVWEFKLTERNNVVLKPYTISLHELLCHCVSIRKFNEAFNDIFFSTNYGQVRLKVMDVYALGTIELDSKCFPFMVQDYSKGSPLHNPLTKNLPAKPFKLSQFFKAIAAQKFTIDPSPVNWNISLEAEARYILNYLDLIFYNDPCLEEETNDLINTMKNSDNFETINL